MRKQFNTLGQLRNEADRLQLMKHYCGVVKSFRGFNPGFDTGFGALSDKALLDHASKSWHLGPALRRKARA